MFLLFPCWFCSEYDYSSEPDVLWKNYEASLSQLHEKTWVQGLQIWVCVIKRGGPQVRLRCFYWSSKKTDPWQSDSKVSLRFRFQFQLGERPPTVQHGHFFGCHVRFRDPLGPPKGMPRVRNVTACFLVLLAQFKANRPFDLLAFPFWSIFSHGPKRLIF